MSDRPTLTVLGLNCWGTFADWDRRRSVLAASVEGLAADVLLVQEVCERPGLDQARELAATFGLAHHVSCMTHANVFEREGLAICSRWPLSGADTLELAPSIPPRRCLYARMHGPGVQVRLAVAHTTFGPPEIRDRQIAQACAVAVKDGRMPAIVAADFNATPDTVAPILAGAGLQDPFPADLVTWPLSADDVRRAWRAKLGEDPPFALDGQRLDYLASRGLNPTECEPLRIAVHGVLASDHAALQVTYRL